MKYYTQKWPQNYLFISFPAQNNGITHGSRYRKRKFGVCAVHK